MGPEVVNRNKYSVFNGPYAGRDLYITMYQESKREFVVTHNADIKPVSYFTGRETELQDLRQRIAEGRKSVLVSGMGGIGKTHICKKLFEEYFNEGENGSFRHIGFIEYNGNMESSLKRCLKYKKQEKQELDQEAAWRELEYLASDGKLLLFVDNVNVSMGQDSGLKRLMSIPGAIVLTSRQRAFSKEFEPYRIGFLDTEKCREIYEKIRYEDVEKRVPEEEVPHLKYIIDTLAARHTITVEFLAHLAWTKNWTVPKLRDELERNGFCLEYIDEEDKLVNIQKSFEKLYDLSELTGAEQNILEAFSVFPYIPLAAVTCNEWLLVDAGVSEDDDILMGLYRKGWLQFDVEKESYALHPVFAQFIYEKCKPTMEKHDVLIWACLESLEIPKSGSVLECQKYILFAKSIVEQVNMEKTTQILFLGSIACVLCYMGEYEGAIEMYKKLIKICMLGENIGYDIVIYHKNLARMYINQMEYEKAEEIYKKMLETYKMDFHSYLNILNELAYAYSLQKRYGDAEKLFEVVLMLCEMNPIEKNALDISALYINLGSVYANQEEYEKAKECFERSLKICEESGLQDSLNMAGAYSQFAGIYEMQKKYEEAEELLKKSLMIHEKVMPDSIDDVDYFNLAYLYLEQERYEEAERLYIETLKKCIKIYGENHLICARGYDALAVLYERKGEYELAVSYNLKTFKILEAKGVNYSMRNVYEDMKKVYSKWKPEGNFNQWLEVKMKE